MSYQICYLHNTFNIQILLDKYFETKKSFNFGSRSLVDLYISRYLIGVQIKSNQVYLYNAYFRKIQGCLQYKTVYVKIKIKLKNSHNYYKYLHHYAVLKIRGKKIHYKYLHH